MSFYLCNRLKIPQKFDSYDFLYFQISSVTSMSFLTDPNLTFHRFSDGTISSDGRKVARNESSVWTTNTTMDLSTTNPSLAANESTTSRSKICSSTSDDEVNKRFSTYSSACNNSTLNTHHNGSTLKLIQVHKEDAADASNKQVSRDREASSS